MTERERLCLEYLSPLMESDTHQIGRYILDNMLNPARGGSNYSSIGAAVVGRLRRQGLVLHIPDLNAWRISTKGREALALSSTHQSSQGD